MLGLANSLITNDYVDWAVNNKDENVTRLHWKNLLNIRYAYLVNDIHELPFYVDGKEDIIGFRINIVVAEGAPFPEWRFQMQKGL